jgi:hypothetical protein
MKAGLLCLTLMFSSYAEAAESSYVLTLQLPLYDSTAKRVSGFSPSLMQAHALTQDYYLGSHRLIAELFGSADSDAAHPLEGFALLAFDYVSGVTPLGLS